MPAKVIDVNLWFKTTTEAMIIRQGERGWPKGSVQGAICQVKVAIYHNHDIWVHQWMILIKKNLVVGKMRERTSSGKLFLAMKNLSCGLHTGKPQYNIPFV